MENPPLTPTSCRPTPIPAHTTWGRMLQCMLEAVTNVSSPQSIQFFNDVPPLHRNETRGWGPGKSASMPWAANHTRSVRLSPLLAATQRADRGDLSNHCILLIPMRFRRRRLMHDRWRPLHGTWRFGTAAPRLCTVPSCGRSGTPTNPMAAWGTATCRQKQCPLHHPRSPPPPIVFSKRVGRRRASQRSGEDER